MAIIASFGSSSHSSGALIRCRDMKSWFMIPPLLANMNLNSRPATVTGRSQEIMVTPLKKELPLNFLLNRSASPNPIKN